MPACTFRWGANLMSHNVQTVNYIFVGIVFRSGHLDVVGKG